MSLHIQIKERIKDALKARDVVRLSVLRGLVAAFTNELVTQKRKPDEELSDEDILVVIKRSANQRKDSIEQFTKGGRNDLAANEKAELKILEEYLPKMMGKDEIRKIAEEKIAELGDADKSKTGLIVGALMKELGGKADGKDVKDIVDELLSQME